MNYPIKSFDLHNLSYYTGLRIFTRYDLCIGDVRIQMFCRRISCLLCSVLLNAPTTMVKTELSTHLMEDRHLNSNLLLRFLIAFDVSLEILPKRRKFLVRIFKDTLESTFRNAVQAYELVIFTKIRIIYEKLV